MLSTNPYTDTINLGELTEVVGFPKNFQKHFVNTDIENGWNKIETRDDTTKTGLRSGAYRKGKTLAIAFKGSDFKFKSKTGTLNDINNDIDLILKLSPSQIISAQNFLKDQIDYAEKNNLNIVLIGHSLGGFLAQCVSSIEHNGQHYSFPYVTFNAPGARGNPAAPHEDLSAGLNFSIEGDTVGKFKKTIGPRVHLEKANKKDNSHLLSSIVTAFDKNKYSKTSIDMIDQWSMNSFLMIENVKINNGRLRYFQRELEQHIIAILRSKPSNKKHCQQLLNRIVEQLFPDKSQFNLSSFNFKFIYYDADGSLCEFKLIKKPEENLSFLIVPAPSSHSTFTPIYDLREPELSKASPVYAKAHMNLLRAELELSGHLETHQIKWSELLRYTASLEALEKRITKTNVDTKGNKALADQAQTLRHVLYTLKNEEDLSLHVSALTELKAKTDNSRKSLGERIVYTANRFIYRLIAPIVSQFSNVKASTISLYDQEMKTRAEFLEKQSKLAEEKLDPLKKIEHLHSKLFNGQLTITRTWSNVLGFNNNYTSTQEYYLKQLSARQIEEWSEYLQSEIKQQPNNSEVNKTIEYLDKIKKLYLQHIYSKKFIKSLQEQIEAIDKKLMKILLDEFKFNNESDLVSFSAQIKIELLESKLRELNAFNRLVSKLLTYIPRNTDNEKLSISKTNLNRLKIQLNEMLLRHEEYLDETLKTAKKQNLDATIENVRAFEQPMIAEPITFKPSGKITLKEKFTHIIENLPNFGLR